MMRSNAPFALTLAAGLAAGAAVGALGYAFWPVVDRAAAPARPAVAQPQFVGALQPIDPASMPMVKPALASAGALPATPQTTAGAAEPEPKAQLAMALGSEGGQTRGLKIDPTSLGAPDAATGPSVEARRLLASGLVALASGDIATARAFLERAAAAGEPRALVALGDSYDPSTLSRLKAIGPKGDAAKARDYYAKAVAAGVDAARERIAELGSP